MLELSHKNLEVWKNSLQVIKAIYSTTKSFPKEEMFGLTNQLRRASVSVISNLSEGLSRTSSQEKCRFLEISRSSLVEIDTQLEIALELNYCTQQGLDEIEKLLNSLFAMITSLIRKIKSKS